MLWVMSELAAAGRWLLVLMIRYTFVVVVYFVVVMKKDDSPQLKLLSSIYFHFPQNSSTQKKRGGGGEIQVGKSSIANNIIKVLVVEMLGLNSEAASIISEYSSTLPKRRHIKGF